MSNEANTTDKRIAGEKTVKKKAGRNVVVSPVNVKATGQTRTSREVTAPIGLVWNEDTTQAVKKPVRAAGRQPERPMITGTGWPDRPPAPKVNTPGPIQYRPAAKKEAVRKTETEPASLKAPAGRSSAGQKAPAKAPERPRTREVPAGSRAPVKREGPVFSSEEKLDALINSVSNNNNTGPANPDMQQKPPERKVPEQKIPAGRSHTQGNQSRGNRPPVRGQGPDNRIKQGNVLYSPVPPAKERMPISPMQKRPATTQVWEGPIQQIPGNTGEFGYGPKFVRTVVTTTTTTYEPVTEDVIRQITSQTSPVALTENVLNQPPAMPPVNGRQVPAQAPAPAGRPLQQQGRQPLRQQAARPGQGQPVRQQPARPGQGPVKRQGQPPAGSRNQQLSGAQAGARPVQGLQPGQNKSIIGTMENKGAGSKPTGMTSQFAEIEKALGLTGDPANAKTGMQPAGGGTLPGQPRPAPAGNPGDPGMVNNNSLQAAHNSAGNIGNGIKDNPAAGNPPGNTDNENRKSMEYMMLFVEGIIFLIVLAICISIFTKIRKGNKTIEPSTAETAVEETQPAEDTGDDGTEDFDVEDAGSDDILAGDPELLESESSDAESTASSSGSVDVDNDKFTLRCTNVTVKLDTEGNPVALIYFTFKNKMSEQKALADVFPISVMQNGEPCDTFAALDEYPEEYYNKDMQISDGSELACAFAVSLKDAVSPIQLTVHDEYDTMSEIGTTEIALQ